MNANAHSNAFAEISYNSMPEDTDPGASASASASGRLKGILQKALRQDTRYAVRASDVTGSDSPALSPLTDAQPKQGCIRYAKLVPRTKQVARDR